MWDCFDPVFPGVTMLHHGERDHRQSLDVPEVGPLARIAEGECRSARARPRRASNAMHVAFRLARQLEIDDMRDARHVDASRGNIGGNENAGLTAAERLERPHPGILRLVAVDGVNRQTGLPQKLADLVGAVLGAGEDKHAIHGGIREQLEQQASTM